MASKLSVNLDTNKESYSVIKCKQNDDITLESIIYENGIAKDLSNATILIQAKKADNTYIIQSTNINKINNIITATLDKDFTRVAGETKLEIVLTESSKQNSTFNFNLVVEKSVIEGAVQSSNTITILQDLQEKVLEAESIKEETEQLIQNGGAATKGDIATVNSQLEEIEQQSLLSNLRNANNFTVKYENAKTTGFQFKKENSITIAHNDSYSIGNNKTIEILVSLKPWDMYKSLMSSGEGEYIIMNKPNSYAFKFQSINNEVKFVADIFNETSNNWIGALKSQTKFNIKMVNILDVESYGASQGIATDGNYIFTSNNRTDQNPYHVHKRDLKGNLIKGLNLPNGYGHPCGMKALGRLLYVPANDYNGGNYIDNKVFIIDIESFEIIKEYYIKYSMPGGGFSAIAYNNGYFYMTDWQTTEQTNIFKFDANFKLISTFKLPTYMVQGIEIYDNKIIVAENKTSTLSIFDIDTKTRIADYNVPHTIEGEDLCITKDGTILHGDVNKIREYRLVSDWNDVNKEIYIKLKLTYSYNSDTGKTTSNFYIDNVLQETREFVGKVNNLNTYGLFVNGNFYGAKKTEFKLRGLGISNSISDNKDISNFSDYEVLWINCNGNMTTPTDVVGATITKTGTLINYTP